MIRRLLRRPLRYECAHGIEWATASSAAYCDCADED